MTSPRFRLLLLLTLLLLAACNREEPAPQPEGEPASQARVTVTSTGLFGVDAQTLASLGWRPTDPLTLTYDGEPHPYQADDSGIYFYLPDTLPTRYSGQHVLWLTHGTAQPEAEPVSADGEVAAVTAEQKLESEAQHNSRFVGDPWFWKSLVAPTTDTHAVQTPGRQDGPVSITVRAAGVTNLEHQIAVQLNGQEAGILQWQGDDRFEETFSLDVPAGETLEIGLVLSGAEGDISLLDEMVVRYPSAPTGTEGAFRGLSEQGGAAQFQNLGANAVAWQIEPEIAPLAVAAGDGGPQVTVPAGQPFVVMERERAQAATVEAAEARAIPAAGAAYVAIVAPELLDTLQPLLDFHREEGLSVMALTPQQVYDAYTFGNVDPSAFQKLVADGQENWVEKPRFVLLVGDSTYDPAGHLDEPPSTYIPSPLIDTVFGGETVSDNVIADVNGDGYPDVALGRFPARTAEQLNTIVQKTIAYSQSPSDGAWRQRVVLTADGREALFQQNSENLRNTLPPEVEALTVYPDMEGDAMAEIVPALNEGGLVVNYVGHGSVQQWGRDQLLTTDAAGGLNNGDKLPIYINMTCLTGLFSHPTQESLSETLLWARGGGAIAAVAPSSLTLPSNQTQMNQTLMAELLSPERPTIGEALMTAKESVVLGTKNDHDIVATFNLLGDPALRPAPMTAQAAAQP